MGLFDPKMSTIRSSGLFQLIHFSCFLFIFIFLLPGNNSLSIHFTLSIKRPAPSAETRKEILTGFFDIGEQVLFPVEAPDEKTSSVRRWVGTS